MKSYTNLEQSKKLAEILPLESADMYIYKNVFFGALSCFNNTSQIGEYIKLTDKESKAYPCWSLGALLEILPKIVNTETLFIETSATLWHVGYRNVHTAIETYLIDACYELIIKLKELNLL